MTEFLFCDDAIDEIRAGIGVDVTASSQDPLARFRGGQIKVESGIAHIDISGALVADESLFTRFIAAIFGGTLYADLQASLETALGNHAIRGVLLTVDSPGGTVAGTQKAAELVGRVAAIKPVVALVTNMAASAAYWVTSAASKVVAEVTTASVGSIGVVATIRDASERDTKGGVRTHQIVSTQSPRKRPDLNTEEGRSQIQSRIDALAGEFIAAVAANRGRTPEQVEKDFGQGDMIMAPGALAIGMIDQIGSRDQAIALLDQLIADSSARKQQKGPAMADETKPTLDAGAIRAEAINGERNRIRGIFGCEEAKGRQQLAQTLALETDMDVDGARKVLAASPKAESNPFAARMAALGNPDVGADAGGESEDDAAAIASTLKLFNGGK